MKMSIEKFCTILQNHFPKLGKVTPETEIKKTDARTRVLEALCLCELDDYLWDSNKTPTVKTFYKIRQENLL